MCTIVLEVTSLPFGSMLKDFLAEKALCVMSKYGDGGRGPIIKSVERVSDVFTVFNMVLKQIYTWT